MRRLFSGLKLIPSLFLAALIACSLPQVTRAQRSAPPSDKITGLMASTISPGESADGKPSFGSVEDVFAGQKGNAPVFAGTGTANYPTHWLLVMVEVTGRSAQPRVELRASEGRRLVTRKIADAYVPTGASFIEPIKTYALFFIEGDRCETLKLTARLVEPENRRAPALSKMIQFVCGE
jgi:hypothetical protein